MSSTVSTPTQNDSANPGDPAPETGTADWKQYAQYRGRILFRDRLSRSMVQIIVEKPDDFEFEPGQGVQMSIDEEGRREDKCPMFIASLPHERRVEFLVHDDGDESTLNQYLAGECPIGTRVLFDAPETMVRNEGPGVMIAAGAGLAAFVSLIRSANQRDAIDGHRLFMVNPTADDVFLQREMVRVLGHSVTSTLTEQQHRDFEHGQVDRTWLEDRVKQYDQPFYLAGPKSMVHELESILNDLGATNIQTVPWENSI